MRPYRPLRSRVEAGYFEIVLDQTCVEAVKGNSDVWTELQVDVESMPRAKLGAVPYALEASRSTTSNGLECNGCVSADELDPAATSDIEARLNELESTRTLSAIIDVNDYTDEFEIERQVPDWIQSVTTNCTSDCKATLVLSPVASAGFRCAS